MARIACDVHTHTLFSRHARRTRGSDLLAARLWILAGIDGARHRLRGKGERGLDTYRACGGRWPYRALLAVLGLGLPRVHAALHAVRGRHHRRSKRARRQVRGVGRPHGSTHRNICQKCGTVYSQEWILASEGVPRCEKCGGAVKPDVVLYEESLNERNLIAAVEAIASCDLLIIGGTSLVVYPAAGLVQYFRGDDLVVCNLQPTPQDSGADLVCACDISKAFDF